MRESHFQRQVMLDLSNAGCRIFRNNVGVARYVKSGKEQVVRYGLCTGSSDLIGWVPVMRVAGWRYALFLAVEVKGAKAKLTDAQEAFQEAVRQGGGVTLVARPQFGTVRGLEARLRARGLTISPQPHVVIEEPFVDEEP